MRVWRIARERYDPLSGEGARLYGGRWNSPGRPVVYAAGHSALAVLEALVWTDPEDVPDDLRLFELEIAGRPRPAVLRHPRAGVPSTISGTPPTRPRPLRLAS